MSAGLHMAVLFARRTTMVDEEDERLASSVNINKRYNVLICVGYSGRHRQ